MKSQSIIITVGVVVIVGIIVVIAFNHHDSTVAIAIPATNNPTSNNLASPAAITSAQPTASIFNTPTAPPTAPPAAPAGSVDGQDLNALDSQADSTAALYSQDGSSDAAAISSDNQSINANFNAINPPAQ